MRALFYLAVLFVLPICSAQYRETDFTVFRDPVYPFAFHYPKNWAPVDATHAATRFKAVSEHGGGEEDISINVVPNPKAKGLPASAHFSGIKKNPELLIAAMRRSIPTVRLVNHGDTTISNQAAYFVVVDYTQSSAGVEVPIRQIQFITGRDGINYTITMRGAPESWSDQLTLFTLLATRFIFTPAS